MEDDFLEQLSRDDSGSDSVARSVIKRGTLSERFAIIPDQRMPEFDTEFGKAFAVRDLKPKNEVYGMILQSNVPIRFKTIELLRKFFNPCFANIMDSGFVNVANGDYGEFALILEKPKGVTLTSFVEERLAKKRSEKSENEDRGESLISEESIFQIVSPLNSILKYFEDNEISHGRIRPDNIFYNPNSEYKIILGEGVSGPAGFSQLQQFEPVERAQAMPIAKGEGDVSHDFFALGVLVFYLATGIIPGEGVDPVAFLTQRINKGTYNTYVGNIDLPPVITDILRGLLTEDKHERWRSEQVENWTRGKRTNIIRPSVRKEATRPFIFLGQEFVNRKALANAFYLNWAEAALAIREGKVVKWLELSVNDKECAEEVQGLIKTTGGEKSRSRQDDDELVSKLLIVMDPSSPIRYHAYAAHLDGIGTMLSYSISLSKHNEIQHFADLLKLNLTDFKATRGSVENRNDRVMFQRLHQYIRMGGFGFGVERCLYELNPNLPCQSMFLRKEFITEVSQLLHFLNDNIGNLNIQDIVDRHMAAFIGSKLELVQEIRIKFMEKLGSQKAKKQMQNLAFLAFAQKKTGIQKLTGLTNYMGDKMSLIVDSFHGKTIKREVRSELKSVSATGSLEAMLQLLSRSDYVQRDVEGFRKARQEFSVASNEVRFIKDQQNFSRYYNSSYQFGLQLSCVISFLFLLSSFIYNLTK